MNIVLGGTGHVGSAVVEALLRGGHEVGLVTRDPTHAARGAAQGAVVLQADIDDVPSLRAAFRRGRRAFLLNPPADVAGDTDVTERRTIANLLAALDGAPFEKVVAASTGGAQPGERLGDLTTLWTLEEGLRGRSVPAAINRAAYYMSNWDGQLDAVRSTGRLQTLFPADLPVPMVAPRDVGEAAARRLVSPLDDVGVQDVEGPARYTAVDVADAFARVLGRPVTVDVVPRAKWEDTFRQLGFSDAAASSYARMTARCVDQGFGAARNGWHGQTTLGSYIESLVANAARG